MSPDSTIALTALGCAIASLLLVGLIARGARRSGLYDMPTDRGLHHAPTPRIGGTAIVAVTGAAYFWAARDTQPILLIPAFIVSVVGLWDDIRSLPSSLRLFIQSGCAIAAIVLANRLHEIGDPFLAATVAVILFFWIIGLTNAFNFMDGSDGIAGGQAVVAGTAWAILGSLSGEHDVATLGLFIAASSVGFLFHNWQPSSIFMGDAGSTFLGFAFAVLPLMSREPLLRGFLEALLVVWPFVFDTTFTLLRRAAHRENVFRAHRKHLYQRLILAGVPHWKVAATYILLAVPGIAASISIRTGHETSVIVCVAIIIASAATLSGVVRAYERSPSRMAATSAAIPSRSGTEGANAKARENFTPS